MPKGFAVIIAFLMVMAWQYRKNKAVLFLSAIVGTLFACAALLSTRWEDFTDLPLRVFALCWLACMLIAGLLATKKLVHSAQKTRQS
jgi:uncharacterized membrane protein